MKRSSNRERMDVKAIIVADLFVNSQNESNFDSPSPDVPFCLLPICNTPLIDYALENLIENNIEETFIVAGLDCHAQLEDHLTNTLTARGRSWLLSDAMKVNIIKANRKVTKIFDVVQELISLNLFTESVLTLFVPIDCVAFFKNLSATIDIHIKRAKANKAYIASLLCTSNRSTLENTLHNVLIRAIAEHDEGNSTEDLPGHEYSSNYKSWASKFTFSHNHGRVVPATPPDHHTMYVLNQQGEVHYCARLAFGDAAAPPPTISFDGKNSYSVRMDLISTGFLLASWGALLGLKFHHNDLQSFFAEMVEHRETENKDLGIIEVSPSTAIVERISSYSSYIGANLSVCSRRLFPLTRESCFAEETASYVVSFNSESVYHHIHAESTQGQLGPNVVLGPHTKIGPDSELAGVICGDSVTIGKGCSLTSCVILDNVTIGDGCVLRCCVLGPGTVIADGEEVVNCVVRSEEEEATGTSSRAAETKWVNSFHPTVSLFTEDVIRRDDDDDSDEDDSDEEDGDGYKSDIVKIVELCFANPHLLNEDDFPGIKQQMTSINVDHARGRDHLGFLVTSLLVERALAKKGSETETLNDLLDLITKWMCFYNFVHLNDRGEPNVVAMEKMLEGLLLPIALDGEDSVLRPSIGSLLRWVHTGDTGSSSKNSSSSGSVQQLYKDRGFGIVNDAALLSFEEEMRGQAETLERYGDVTSLDSEDKLFYSILEVVPFTREYIQEMKNSA